MATERLLKTTLALYHDNGIVTAPGQSQRDAELQRVFGSTAASLSSLSNPLNISLLVSHFLTAPAVWGSLYDGDGGIGSRLNRAAAASVCFRVISIFNIAAIHVHRHELEESAAAKHGLIGAAAYRLGVREDRRPGCEDWARAIAQGADAKSPRWRHVLVLVGVLLGLEGSSRKSLSRARRAALEQGVVAAANLALAEAARTRDTADADLGRYAVVSGLNFAFPLLSEHARASLDCDLLLPASVEMLAGPFGFDGGRILELIATDARVHTTGARQLDWPASSASFQTLQQRETSNAASLVPSAGPIAVMASFAVERAADPMTVLHALTTLFELAEATRKRWLACRVISGRDLTADTSLYLTTDTAQRTWPLLWQHLKKTLYAVATMLQAIVGRSLLDRVMASDGVAPGMAAKVLRVLHGLDFIASHDNGGAFQAHRFAYLASIDILARYPDASAALLAQIVPTPPLAAASLASMEPARVAADLFYLNLAEHFSSVLPTKACEGLLVQPALPYVTAPASPSTLVASQHMVEVFEAAHSAVLSVLSSPHNAPIAAALGPFYADALFASFPTRVSARQFRLAFKTLIQILSPPFPVYATHPELAETLLEMVRFRATHAGGPQTQLLPPSPGDSALGSTPDPVSEQSALVLTLIDALPFLALPVLEYWLTTAAETVWTIQGTGSGGADSAAALRQVAQRRFWEVLGSGEMDVERAAVGVAWWGNGEGGELVMGGGRGGGRRAAAPHDVPVMSGALPSSQANL